MAHLEYYFGGKVEEIVRSHTRDPVGFGLNLCMEYDYQYGVQSLRETTTSC